MLTGPQQGSDGYLMLSSEDTQQAAALLGANLVIKQVEVPVVPTQTPLKLSEILTMAGGRKRSKKYRFIRNTHTKSCFSQYGISVFIL